MGVRAKGYDKSRETEFVLFNIDEEDLEQLKQGAILVVCGDEIGLDHDIHLAYGSDEEIGQKIAPALQPEPVDSTQ